MKFNKMLSLLTAAAMSVSCFAGLSISVDAASTAYAEFVFDSAYNTSIGADNTTATVTNSAGIDTLPLLTTNNTEKSYSSTKVTSYTLTLPYSGNSQTWSKALKGSNGNGFILTSNLSANDGYDAYNLTIIYASHSDETSSVCTVTDNNTSAAIGSSTSTSTSDIQTLTLSAQTAAELKIIWGTYQPRLYYIGIEYYNSANSKPDQNAVYTTIYQLSKSNGAEAINIGEGLTGSVKPTTANADANAPDIAVNSKNNGKLNNENNNDWAQINVNTVLTLPNVTAGTTLTFSLYSNTGLTIDETEYTNGQIYTAATDGDVVMTCTTGGYIATITVVGKAFGTITGETPATPEPTESATPVTGAYSNTWNFGKANGAPEFNLQNAPEYDYTVQDANGVNRTITINTTTNGGKLNNIGRSDKWCQCNIGTTFSIPAYKGMKITWDIYTANETTGFKVDGTLYNNYYIADGTANSVSIIAWGVGYLSEISVEPTAIYDISGTLDAAEGAALAGSSMKFTAANGQAYTAEIETGNTFSISLPAQSYTAAILNDSYVIPSASASITVNSSTMTLPVSAATEQTVSGSVANPPKDAYTLTFTSAVGKETTINLDGGAKSYTTQLSSGTYKVSSESGTLSPLSQTSFDVADAEVTKKLYFPEIIPPATSQNITVNQNATVTENVYNTVADAVSAAAAGKISNPIITLTSGQTYQEQVLVNYPNVTLKTSGTDKATITWYYGIGQSYYSLGSDGYYNKDRAMTQTTHLTNSDGTLVGPYRWGAALLVQKDGSGFKAENIIIKNTFNEEYVDAEFEDGVTPNGAKDAGQYDRTPREDRAAADSKTATERAAAIGFENNPTGCELYNCEFISSQDTFFTGGSIYVKDCKISGDTDYIFGGGKVVFDNCDLIWHGYSDIAGGGYITANKSAENSDESYIFRNCTVKNSSRAYTGGKLGRDWGGVNSHVCFLNTTFSDNGSTTRTWENMGGAVTAGTADLHIFDFDPTVNTAYSTSGAAGANVNGVLDFAAAKAKFEGIADYLGFTPEHLTNAETTTNVADSADGTVHGVVTTVTAGSGATIKGMTWTVTNGSNINTFSTGNVKNRTFPTITGGTAEIAMMFNAATGTYDVLSQVIE